jgi:anaerobic magnesium-protoporphyrin IX monomethyl ester cyclase
MLDVLLVGAEELENLGTRYLAAVLRQHGFSVQLAAFSTEADGPAVIDLARRTLPRLVGLSLIFQYRAPEFLRLAADLRRELPGAHITVGGHFPSFADAELLDLSPDLDSVVRGEGEYTLLELVQRLDDRQSWSGIHGLSFRQGGRVMRTPPRPLIRDLDTLPFPARDTPPQQDLGMGFSPILGSRGCHCNCSFCSISAFYGASGGSSQRFRSVANMAEEMEDLYRRFGVRFFVFNDDEWFPAGRARVDRVNALASELRRRQLDAIMSIKCRADDVEEDLFRRLLEMGVVRAYVGVESGSDHSLRTLNKHTTAAQNERALETLNKVGILADFGLIFFDPDSTVEDIQANLGFFHRMAGDGQAPLSFGRLEVYAGTPILHRLQREGRLSGDFLAWNYTISDPRVELLFRLMVTTMRHRHYDSDGLSKQCSMSCYRLAMYKHVMGTQADPRLADDLRGMVARLNNHSLALLEDMLRFTMSEDIYEVNRVNDQAAVWAGQVNLYDMAAMAEVNDWQGRLESDATRAAAHLVV